MNDRKLDDALASAKATMQKRIDQLAGRTGTHTTSELDMYVEAIDLAVARIRELEREAAEKLQMRDKIALQILPSLSGHNDYGMAIGEALNIADLYIEARKEPRTTIVPVRS